MLHYTSDHVDINWFPAGFYIVEQGEPSIKLYLILSGEAEVLREHDDGSQEKLADLGAGVFFGEEGLAHNQPRNAHVIASSPVTCLTFSPEEPTQFAGRGDTAQLTESANLKRVTAELQRATTCITVTDFVAQKVRALSQHRTQFPIQPDMFPLELLQEIFGQEYFVRVMPSRILEDELI
jgi:CRP-like cAMP-binding protein